MNARTVYVTGIKKYQVSIMKGLLKSKLVEGRDYIQGVNESDFALVWVDETIDLKTLKGAIGAKYVWKHRMRFFENIEDLKPKTSNELTRDEKELIVKIRKEMALMD